MRAEIFLDTAYVIALSSLRDYFHTQALGLADQMLTSRAHLVTTRAIFIEVGNALAKQRYRHAAVTLLCALEADPNVEVVPLSEELYARALACYRESQDKEWGLTDCVSFVVMQERGIVDALTTDEHFRQAGFRALLREKAG